jgi:hypothetical protein
MNDPRALPWQVAEIVHGIETRRIYAASVDIKVNTKTERAFTDKAWWNIACEGQLLQEDNNITILPLSV